MTTVLALLILIRLIISADIALFELFVFTVAGVLIMLNWLRLYPYTRFGKKVVRDADHTHKGKSIRMVISNLLYDNERRETLFSLIEKQDPDVLIVLELTPEWSADISEFLQDKYPNRFIHERSDPFGMGFYSKYPIEDKKYFRIYNEYPTLKGRLSVDGDPVDLWVVHPSPPSPIDSDTSIPKDVEFRELGRKIDGVNERTIVAGDLNDVAWSKATREMVNKSRLGDPRKGRGLIITFPVFAPVFGFPLDQVFLSDHFSVDEFAKLENIGSDHYPLLISVSLDQ